MQVLVDPFLVSKHDAAEAAALAIDMLGGGIDDDMGAEFQRLLEEWRRKDVVDDDLGADLVGELGHTGNVDDFERRVGRAFQEEDLGVLLDRLFPVGEIAAVDQRAFDAVFRRQRLDHPAAGTEQRTGGNDMIAGLQLAEDCRGNGSHARSRGARVFGAFQHAHALFEHVVGRAAVAGIDEAFGLALETRFCRLGCLVDEALGEEDRLGRLAVLGAGGSAVDELCCRAPVFAHVTITFKNKKNRPQKWAGLTPGLFSYLFNVAASRPAKSPRDKASILLGCACVNSRSLVLSRNWKEDCNGPRYWDFGRPRDRRAARNGAPEEREAAG
ncbi:hypothetical protein D9M72_461430 [compost metagenome]